MNFSLEALPSIPGFKKLSAIISNSWHFIEHNNLVIPFLCGTALLSIWFIVLALLIYFNEEEEDNKISPLIENLMSEEDEIVRRSLSRPISLMPDVEVVKLTKLLMTVVKGRGLSLDLDDEVKVDKKEASKEDL